MNDYIVNAFTREGDNTNFQANNITAGCITSANNKFGIDSEGNITAKSLTIEDMRIATQLVLDVMYPVGSIYISTTDVSPSAYFGGQWEKIEDKFLLGSGNYELGSIGGEAEHVLTIAEMPSHSHSSKTGANKSVQPYSTGKAVWPTYYEANGKYNNINITGENQPHNNMPPYLTVNIWKRTN